MPSNFNPAFCPSNKLIRKAISSKLCNFLHLIYYFICTLSLLFLCYSGNFLSFSVRLFVLWGRAFLAVTGKGLIYIWLFVILIKTVVPLVWCIVVRTHSQCKLLFILFAVLLEGLLVFVI